MSTRVLVGLGGAACGVLVLVIAALALVSPSAADGPIREALSPLPSTPHVPEWCEDVAVRLEQPGDFTFLPQAAELRVFAEDAWALADPPDPDEYTGNSPFYMVKCGYFREMIPRLPLFWNDLVGRTREDVVRLLPLLGRGNEVRVPSGYGTWVLKVMYLYKDGGGYLCIDNARTIRVWSVDCRWLDWKGVEQARYSDHLWTF